MLRNAWLEIQEQLRICGLDIILYINSICFFIIGKNKISNWKVTLKTWVYHNCVFLCYHCTSNRSKFSKKIRIFPKIHTFSEFPFFSKFKYLNFQPILLKDKDFQNLILGAKIQIFSWFYYFFSVSAFLEQNLATVPVCSLYL